jgi:hypothetical protein
MTTSPGITDLPLAGTAARGRNGWFNAYTATLSRTDTLISTSAYGLPATQAITLHHPGVTISIQSKRAGKMSPIFLQLTRTDAIAVASAILAHADATPTVLVTVDGDVPTLHAHGPVRTLLIDPAALPTGSQHIQLLREEIPTLPEPLRGPATDALADLDEDFGPHGD